MPRPPLGNAQWGNISYSDRRGGAVRADARYRDASGRLRRARGTGATQAAAREAMERNAHEAVQRPPGTGSKELTPQSSIAELATAWLALREAERSVESQTLDNYRWQIRDYIVPRFGHWTLADATVGRLDRVLVDMRIEDGKQKAYRTRSILVSMFRLAATYDLTTVHLAAQTTPVKREQKPIVALTISDVHRFRESLTGWCDDGSAFGPKRGRQLLQMFEVLIGTGMRIGEVLALRPSHVNFETNQILVAATLTYSKEAGLRVQEYPKREGQRRWIPMTGTVRAVLQAQIDVERADDATIFHSRNGNLLWPNNVRRSFRRFLADTQLGQELTSLQEHPFSPDALRRSTAAGVAESLSAEAARDLLGHATVATTERSYVKRSGVVDPQIADLVEHLFGPVRSQG